MIGDLNISYWLIVFVCLFCFTTTLSLFNISGGLISSTDLKDLKNRQIAMEKSAKITSMPYAIAVFFGLAIGTVIDKYGNRPIFLLISCIIGLLGILMFYIANTVIAMVCIGVSYSIFSNAIFSSLPLLVKRKQFVKKYFNYIKLFLLKITILKLRKYLMVYVLV